MAASITARFCQHSVRNVIKNSFKRADYCHLKVRCYARGTWRGPRDVMTVEEEQSHWRDRTKLQNPRENPYIPYESQDPVHRSMASEPLMRFEKVRLNKSPKKSMMKENDKRSVITKINDKSYPKYEKLEEGDKRFGQAILSAKSRKEREKKKVIFLEGHRLIQDALDSGATAKCIYFSDKDLLERLRVTEGFPLYKVQYRHLKMWSDTQTPAGVMAIFVKPETGECTSPIASPLPLTLICDSVRDPGNMGTLIRTAAAVGCQRIITTKGCVDVWEPKVLRSGMGSHFHIPIFPSIPWEILLNYVSDNTQVLIAETGKQNTDHRRHHSLTVDDIDELANTDDIESLSDSAEKYASFMPKTESNLSIDKSYLDKDHVKRMGGVPIECVSYDKLKCSESHVAVIIGGETTGVSHAAKKFALDRFGKCVTIPMSPVVNSLNSAIAASVILYEVRKHVIGVQ